MELAYKLTAGEYHLDRLKARVLGDDCMHSGNKAILVESGESAQTSKIITSSSNAHEEEMHSKWRVVVGAECPFLSWGDDSNTQ